MIRVRSATVSDMPTVLRLIREGAREGALLQRPRKELLLIAQEGNILCAFDNGGIAGMVVLDLYSKRLAEVRSLYVLPGRRGMGVGAALVAHAIKRAKRFRVKELMTITLKENAAWFARHGFSEDAHDFKTAMFKKL